MSCDLCREDGGELLWRGPGCRVVHVDEPGYPGFCRVIWAAHVKEMTDLPEDARVRLMHVVFEVEAVLREMLRPHKVNLASLGNITPHLHWHIIPRFADDPHFPNSIWATRIRAPDARGGAQLIDSLRSALAQRLG